MKLEYEHCASLGHGIFKPPLIHGLSGRHMLTRSERRQLKYWACLAPSLTGEAVCPSETVQADHQSYDGLRISGLEVAAARSHVRKLQVLQSKCFFVFLLNILVHW
jgi:hypothetical protein